MENIKNKNSEDFALMAMLQSFSIQFRKGMLAGLMSSKVKKNVKKAMELDESNLRAYYVAASSDYYTPAKYGGGKKAESYLLKAIELPSQKMKNEYLPSWGKEEAYNLLIKMYIKKEDWEKAKQHYQAAIAEFPEDYNISKLASKLVVNKPIEAYESDLYLSPAMRAIRLCLGTKCQHTGHRNRK